MVLEDNFKDRLIAYFKLNENAGRLARNSAGIYTSSGEATLSSDTDLKMTPRGMSAYFRGVSTNKITAKKPISVDFGTLPMTVSAWFRFETVGNYRYIASDYNAGVSNAQFSMLHTNTNKLTFFWARGGTQYPNPFTAASVTTTQAGVWYHCVGIRSGSTGSWQSKIYVNGVLENTTSTIGNPAPKATTSGNVVIGGAGDYASGLVMVGDIQRVMIWTRALADTEVLNLFLKQRNLVNNWGT